MLYDIDTLQKSKMVLEKIAKGVNPISGEAIDEVSFLNDPGVIRCFYSMAEVLENVMNGTMDPPVARPQAFVITPEQKTKVVFPPVNIGVNEFSKCINACLSPGLSKKLTGAELNKRLKKLGVVSEESLPDGKKRTIINDNSITFGFEAEKREYNGIPYDKVVINDQGKSYLLENIEAIMNAS